jgi:hypothetical protein
VRLDPSTHLISRPDFGPLKSRCDKLIPLIRSDIGSVLLAQVHHFPFKHFETTKMINLNELLVSKGQLVDYPPLNACISALGLVRSGDDLYRLTIA